MGTEHFIDLHASSGSGGGIENNDRHKCNSEPSVADCQPSCDEVKEGVFNRENLKQGECEIQNLDEQHIQVTYLDKDFIDKPLKGSVELIETATVVGKMNSINSGVHKNCIDCPKGKYEQPHDVPAISGVKRARTTYDDQQPLVHVIYNSISRKSKKKLEELLHHWSEWHAQQCSSSKDSDDILESGEETYFPALRVGPETSSTVSFWMDNQVRKKRSKDFISLDDDSVPIYDREYTSGLTSIDGLNNLERGLEKLDASRCFNCGSYNHSLKECPKPRDNVAVTNARKQHQSKRNQTAHPRNPTRYYQNSPGGKYDGLKPGVLGAETRKLLGLGELDPPPWLNRMREMGYPPGYLDHEDEDGPSGISIYADEETKEEHDENVLNLDNPEPQKKMSVDFPGINAPIPENAEQRGWAASQGPLSFDSSKNQSNRRSNCSSGVITKGLSHDQRWSSDYTDGWSPVYSPGVNSYSPGFNPNYTSESLSPRSNIPIPRSPSLGRSLSDRGRWSPLVHEGSPIHSPYSFLPYSFPNPLQSPQNSGLPGFEARAYESHNNRY